ncbi:MAG: hypothetical protein OEV28_01045 [Nitrospirota bacterium]|nr:hypothetical protein [Nitrospirota bacterium]
MACKQPDKTIIAVTTFRTVTGIIVVKEYYSDGSTGVFGCSALLNDEQ